MDPRSGCSWPLSRDWHRNQSPWAPGPGPPELCLQPEAHGMVRGTELGGGHGRRAALCRPEVGSRRVGWLE